MDGSKLLLLPANNSDNLALYIRNTEWTLTDFAVKLYEKRYDCCLYPFPDLTFFFVLKRSPSYYIFTLIIPSTCITVVTIVGFFTPHSTTGENTEKVSLGVNALLSMSIIMMMVSGEVPATSEVVSLLINCFKSHSLNQMSLDSIDWKILHWSHIPYIWCRLHNNSYIGFSNERKLRGELKSIKLFIISICL